MVRIGYSALSDEAFVGFRRELDRDGWDAVRGERYQRIEAALHDTPVLAFWKDMLAWAIDAVVASRRAANDTSLARVSHAQSAHADKALRTCAAVFTHAHAELAAMRASARDPASREALDRLVAPLERLALQGALRPVAVAPYQRAV